MDKIGRGNASRYFLTGERFKAPEAQRIGLINDKYASIEEVDKAVNGVLAEIGSSGPEVLPFSIYWILMHLSLIVNVIGCASCKAADWQRRPLGLP